MSQTRFIFICDKCNKEFDLITEGQMINEKIPRCYKCQPTPKFNPKFIRKNVF